MVKNQNTGSDSGMTSGAFSGTEAVSSETGSGDATGASDSGADIVNGEGQTAYGENGDTKTDDKEKQEKKAGGPKVSFLNFADLPFDLGFGGGSRSKVKRAKKGEAKPIMPLSDVPAPHKIKAMLDEYVVGQEKAKKALSVAVYNHYKRVAVNMSGSDIEIEKSNILMLGPTGSGKTYLVRTLAKILNVPLAITDATALTEAGYIGDDIESVVSKLLAAADNDADKAEQGIIYIDEIDKIAKKSDAHARDVSGESVQQGMLKLLEGSNIEVPVGSSSKNAMVPTTVINTRNILFICGGAFPGLEKIIEERLKKTTSIGFKGEVKSKDEEDRNILNKAETEDIRKFGMIPEFVGRLPMVFALDGLDEEMLVKILKEPKNAIVAQYQKLLELDGVKLEFADEALEVIAKKAIEKKTGARALRAILDEYMIDIMYEIPKDENIGTVTITGDYLEGKGAPLIEMRTMELPG
ncbi:MAG: ATP-dependent Clp protease ATP-binding subunit ClpX [Lachnospiraceae bacterium]|nr:ATP-dependent Clp protease ATP-binding subunit ClpX [Lachnospiraceae bacterium]